MPLESPEPKGRHWENVALPVISTLTPGSYANPLITVDEFGRITVANSGIGNTGIAAQDSGAPVIGGPFSILNFSGPNISAVDGGGGILDITVSSTGSITGLDEGAIIPNGPFSAINFSGPGVTATDAGGGQLDVVVPGASVANNVEFVKDTGGTAATQNIGSPVPATAIVRTVSVTITVPYSVGTTLQVEDSLSNVLMTSSLINPQVAGTYKFESPGNTNPILNTQVVLVVGGAPVSGACVVEMLYLNP